MNILRPRDFNEKRFTYDAMMPVFPLLAQQCMDDYQLRRNVGHPEGYRRLTAEELEAVAIKAGIADFKIIEEKPEAKKGGRIEMHKPME